MELKLIVPLLGLLLVAVAVDLLRHRIPNLLVFLGLTLGCVGQVFLYGVSGFGDYLSGAAIGFAVFIPMYAVGGMAAGDVKLMAMVGGFLSAELALWASVSSLIVGGLYGILIVLFRGQIVRTFSRYNLMLRTRSYFSPAADEVVGKKFPYSVSILLGTLVALLWQPLGW